MIMDEEGDEEGENEAMIQEQQQHGYRPRGDRPLDCYFCGGAHRAATCWKMKKAREEYMKSNPQDAINIQQSKN